MAINDNDNDNVRIRTRVVRGAGIQSGDANSEVVRIMEIMKGYWEESLCLLVIIPRHHLCSGIKQVELLRTTHVSELTRNSEGVDGLLAKPWVKISR